MAILPRALGFRFVPFPPGAHTSCCPFWRHVATFLSCFGASNLRNSANAADQNPIPPWLPRIQGSLSALPISTGSRGVPRRRSGSRQLFPVAPSITLRLQRRTALPSCPLPPALGLDLSPVSASLLPKDRSRFLLLGWDALSSAP